MLQIYTYYFSRPFTSLFNESWVNVVLILSLALFAVLLTFRRNRLQYVPEALVSESGMNKLEHDGRLLEDWSGYLMMLFYTIITALFYYELFSIRDVHIGSYKGLGMYSIIAAVVFGLPVAKMLFVSFMLMLADCRVANSKFLSTIITYNFAVGTILLPILFLTTYTNIKLLIYIALGIIVLLYALEFVILFLNGMSYKKLQNIYFFVYLCILKILPAIIIGLITTNQL